MTLHRWLAFNDSGRRVGQEHPRAKYTDSEVRAVIYLSQSGLSTAEIARKMEMPRRTVLAYIRGERRGQPTSRWIREEF